MYLEKLLPLKPQNSGNSSKMNITVHGCMRRCCNDRGDHRNDLRRSRETSSLECSVCRQQQIALWQVWRSTMPTCSIHDIAKKDGVHRTNKLLETVRSGTVRPARISDAHRQLATTQLASLSHRTSTNHWNVELSGSVEMACRSIRCANQLTSTSGPDRRQTANTSQVVGGPTR